AAPGLTAVERHRRSLVEAEEHALAVRRVDPRDMWIHATRRALECHESLAPIRRSINGGADRVNDVGVLRVHPDAGAIRALPVRNARVARGHVLPRCALIVRPIQARTALKRSANDVNALAVSMHRDRDADAAIVLREHVDLFPRLALVGRLVECRAVWPLWCWPTAAESAASAL